MATKRILVDASHPEETRVVSLTGNRLEEFDLETAARKRLKGNIYLAKVTRVEPSLQAAFVDYGGNRHGFLAFSEIHPDYYQIPVADREALLAEQAKTIEESREDDDINNDEDNNQSDGQDETDESGSSEDNAGDDGEDNKKGKGSRGRGKSRRGGRKSRSGPETLGGDETDEVGDRPSFNLLRRYKIQEVIKKNQILLVQVVKEERGNKGAALTTYISLAGRYCVLMPNAGRGGGISRKISNQADRKRLKQILKDLKIPGNMAVIVRTAGAQRSKAEIRRDYEYLVRQWNEIRELTLKSSAPALIYEEASLIKRVVRDMYTRDVDEIIIDGDEAYKNAKAFMKMMIPSHAKKIKQYKDRSIPLLQRYQVENELDAIHSASVELPSGGYVVINPTEALVSIDVNSGRATRERNIEETALKTNLEAAEEIARQLRLRDLAGLIVIDFIDMMGHRNNHTVERKLKEALKQDRARIQVGRISSFGLLEMSRQRLRPSLAETSSEVCPYCGGSGIRRSIDSSAMHVLRAIEEEGARQRTSEIRVVMATEVALYVMNYKRSTLQEMEDRFNLRIVIQTDDTLIPPDHRIERLRGADGQQEARQPEEDTRDEDDTSSRGKRRRRPRKKRGKRDNRDQASAQDTQQGQQRDDQEQPEEKSEEKAGPESREDATAQEGDSAARAEGSDDGEKAKKSSGRGGRRRGGRGRKKKPESASAQDADEQPDKEQEAGEDAQSAEKDAQGKADKDTKEEAGKKAGEKPKPKRRRKPKKSDQESKEPAEAAARASEDTAKSNVIVVGGTDDDKESDERSGWWNKIIK